MPESNEEPPGRSWPESATETLRRDSFVAWLAHEIRNPLAPIRSGVALMQSARLDEQGRSEVLAMMERQLSHLVRLVDDLLVSVPVHGGEAPARKTSRQGRVAVEVMIADDAAEIRFSDTAIGIPAEDLAGVFELYGRSGAAIGEGLGIGLALVRGLVEMNGGTVDAIDRAPEAGTLFVVRMPLCQVDEMQAVAAAVTAQPAAPWRSRRILVADDNRDAAQTLGTLLELDGHTVRLAHDGPTAVAEARAFGPELVLMDIGLPGYSGLAATREIRGMALASRPVIVALTGWGSAADRQATHAAGCDLHLVKPIHYREIARTLALTAADKEPK